MNVLPDVPAQGFSEVTMIQRAGNHKLSDKSTQLDHEWAVILAGGDGTRLKSLTRKIAGDERPKQFCSVLGNTTLLEETQRRAALELAKERTLFIVNQIHRRYYTSILADIDSANLVAQPRNAGTAPAILSACCVSPLPTRRRLSLSFRRIISSRTIQSL